MLKEATKLGDKTAILYSHIVLARHRMEIGDYPTADKSLDHIRTALTEYGNKKIQEGHDAFSSKLACKYYHLASKNKMRAYYFETSKEILEEGINVVKELHNETLRDKFLAKLYETYAALMCEPLYFSKCEEYLNKAEEIYTKNKHLEF